MKIGELIEKLNERQKKTVQRCLEMCKLMDVNEEIELEIDNETVRFLKVISNPLRLSILKMLRDRWLCVCIIAEGLEQDQTLISHHLRSLKEMDLVYERREGKLKFYRTNIENLSKYLEKLSSDFRI
ncbi:MAG: winged helix-turn-helix transcriptional regulator [Palaeococcus sp.]|uniref:ArsR/SmtB family transcription factor n=1 Tax=Palaeococcus sp. (in: euryarchaeotes) TaxID=2820298 RepID=UPI0025D23F4E|nr:metalloregulator ArsR/SmtB family transcription factor [Palaeococcus sp. (in: euryarchaeotes)]MCD6558441.1 winged helix-turn-helix transcriptional regulator [Palaeococcus sp. (in: euryarchaeotes)]